MPDSQRQPRLRRVVVEFVIIFAGVTLGLLADDLRQRRSDAVEARQALTILERDLVTDSAEWATSRSILHQHADATAWIQRNWGRDQVTADSAGLAFRAYLSVPQHTFPRSAFESLRASNRLSLIEPDSMRAAVIEYYDEQARYEDAYLPRLIDQKERTVDRFSPYFLRPPGVDSTVAFPLAPGPATMTVPWSRIRTDSEAYNQVSYSGTIAAAYLGLVARQQERNSTLLAMLRGR